ncbi:UNVERIFIED_CONTAM: hypothetical protein FKN15_072801 [Acipenser sinensis]
MTTPHLSNEDRMVAIGMIEGGLSERSCPENEMICFDNQQPSPEKPGNRLFEGQATSWKAEGHHTSPRLMLTVALFKPTVARAEGINGRVLAACRGRCNVTTIAGAGPHPGQPPIQDPHASPGRQALLGPGFLHTHSPFSTVSCLAVTR